MSLQSISNQELVSRMEKLVRTERKITHLILIHILEIESRKIFADLGYDGMYTYLTRGLGYSEAAAYRRLQSARLLKSVPEVAQKIESGKLNLSQLTQVQQCVKESLKRGNTVSKADTQEILAKLENRNSFETKLVLAQEFDVPVKDSEVVRPQKDESVRLETVFSAEQWEELNKAKSHLSHVVLERDWSAVITGFAKKINQMYELKEKRNRNRNDMRSSAMKQAVIATGAGVGTTLDMENNLTPTVESYEMTKGHSNGFLEKSTRTKDVRKKNSARPREYISIHMKRKLLTKAQHCCEFQNHKTGVRCRSTFQLQVDHIKPWSRGGTNETKNLRILCGVHNRQVFRNFQLNPESGS